METIIKILLTICVCLFPVALFEKTMEIALGTIFILLMIIVALFIISIIWEK